MISIVYLVLHLRVAKSKWPKKIDSFSCTNVAFIFIKQIRMREMMYTMIQWCKWCTCTVLHAQLLNLFSIY
jgi:hypothetical protein